jgi:hypothetical protein
MKKSSKPIIVTAEIPPKRKLPAQAIMSMAFLHLWFTLFVYKQLKSTNYRGQLGKTLFSIRGNSKIALANPSNRGR